MPNWCHNTLTVEGDEETLKSFVSAVENETQPLSFSKIIAQPEDVQDWYGWRCQHWGTKWDAAFADAGVVAVVSDTADLELTKTTQGRTVTPTVAIYKFDTAWSPPVEFVDRASMQHPELEFVLRFAEVGEGYAGEIKFLCGERISEEELEVDEVLAPEEMWF